MKIWHKKNSVCYKLSCKKVFVHLLKCLFGDFRALFNHPGLVPMPSSYLADNYDFERKKKRVIVMLILRILLGNILYIGLVSSSSWKTALARVLHRFFRWFVIINSRLALFNHRGKMIRAILLVHHRIFLAFVSLSSQDRCVIFQSVSLSSWKSKKTLVHHHKIHTICCVIPKIDYYCLCP